MEVLESLELLELLDCHLMLSEILSVPGVRVEVGWEPKSGTNPHYGWFLFERQGRAADRWGGSQRMAAKSHRDLLRLLVEEQRTCPALQYRRKEAKSFIAWDSKEAEGLRETLRMVLDRRVS